MTGLASAMWSRFVAEVNTPSDQQNWYAWATNQCGHALLGAGLAVVLMALGAGGWFAWVFCVGSYAIWKEANDLQRGGTRRDGLADVLFLGLGALHMTLWWWPVLSLAGVGLGVIMRLRNE